MDKLLKFIVTEIVYNGHLQALGAVGIVYVSSVIAFNKNPGLELLILVYCVFQFIYFFDRYHDIEKDRLTNKRRSVHLDKYLNKIPFVLIGFFVVVVVGNLLFGNSISLISSLVVMSLGALYPLYFKKLTNRIFMFKNVYVSSVHALLVFYPVVYYPAIFLNDVVWVIFLLVISEGMLMQVPLDVKDIEADKKVKLKTFPVKFGFNNSILFIKTQGYISFVVFLFLGYYFGLRAGYYMLLVVMFVANQLIAYRINKGQFDGYLLAAAKFSLWILVGFIASFQT